MPTKTPVPAVVYAGGGVAHAGVCPLHGNPTSVTNKRTLSSSPPLWAVLLVLFSLLIGLLVLLAVRKQVTGQMPLCSVCTSKRKNLVMLTWGAWVGCFVVFVAAAGANSNPLGLLSLTLFIAAAVLGVLTSRSRARAFVTKDGYWVEFWNAHPRFVQALSALAQSSHVQPTSQQPTYQQPAYQAPSNQALPAVHSLPKEQKWSGAPDGGFVT